jgi:uncharacterized RDD family membrane protein YckC
LGSSKTYGITFLRRTRMSIKRIVAYLIDYIILWILLLLLVGIGYFITGYLSPKQNEIFVFVGIYIITFTIPIYIALKDIVFRNASTGKKIMRIHVVSTNGNQMVLSRQLVSRNLFGLFLLPIEFILILFGQTRMGDYYAKTEVVENTKL